MIVGVAGMGGGGYGGYGQPQQQHMMTQQSQQAAMFPQQAGPNAQFTMRQDYQQRNIRPSYLQVNLQPLK